MLAAILQRQSAGRRRHSADGKHRILAGYHWEAVSAEVVTIHEHLPDGPRSALHACALALGATRGPTLLISSVPQWESVLRTELGDRLFTRDDPARPTAQAWIGGVWLEPHWRTWRSELRLLLAELPRGALLSIVTSLPAAFLRGSARANALGVRPTGFWWLRRALRSHSFRIERSFGFQTPWWSALGWIAERLQARRPDWSDRVQYLMRRRFATADLWLPFATTGLIQARAGMRP